MINLFAKKIETPLERAIACLDLTWKQQQFALPKIKVVC